MSIPQRNTALVLAVTAVLSLPFLVSVAAAFGGDELETIDLSELSDGETRTFEHADGEIVATRDGNRVVLEIVGADGGHKILMHRSLECDLDDSDCFVRLGSDGDGANTFVFEVRGDDDDPDRIRREVRIVTEHGEHEGIAESIVIGGAPHVRIHRFDGEHGEGHTSDSVTR